MGQLSPRLGYFVISLGILLQMIGLVGDSLSGAEAGQTSIASLQDPSHVLLVLGMGVTVLGTLLGGLSLAQSLTSHEGEALRLLPLLPLVLLLGVSVGSASFAYQAGGSATNGQPAPLTLGQPGPLDCPPGTFWHEEMGHCMILSASAAGSTTTAPGPTPVCPDGYFWHQEMLHCMAVTASTAPLTVEGGSPVCPEGYFWHQEMLHCMALSVSTSPDAAGGATPSCPDGYFWHEEMNHCMAITLGPAPTPGPGPTPTCPDGYFWHEEMNHCMAIGPAPADPPGPTSPPEPTPTLPPGVTPTPTPTCPEGYFWHPDMNHCMSDQCPPGLVFNYETLYCELPSGEDPTPTPEATPTPTSTPTPTCPDGYFWHPAMNHCMSDQCPPGLVFNYETLYCELPE